MVIFHGNNIKINTCTLYILYISWTINQFRIISIGPLWRKKYWEGKVFEKSFNISSLFEIATSGKKDEKTYIRSLEYVKFNVFSQKLFSLFRKLSVTITLSVCPPDWSFKCRSASFFLSFHLFFLKRLFQTTKIC